MLGGRSYRPGDRFRRDDPVVVKHPEMFSTIPVPLTEILAAEAKG